MTDNEIIKALVCCIAPKCGECPIFNNSEIRRVPGRCVVTLEKNALDLINRQKAEIERLQELLNGWKTEAYKVADEKDKLYCEAVERVKTTKAEAIKEFAQKAVINLAENYSNEYCHWIDDTIDNLVREMVGDSE